MDTTQAQDKKKKSKYSMAAQKSFSILQTLAVITCRLRRLAGLVKMGLGDFPERGVESVLPAVPFAVKTGGKK